MYLIQWRSEPRGDKPETMIVGECDHIRERELNEPVHHKKRLGQTRCLICHAGGKGKFMAWLPSQDNHQEHRARCTA